MHLIITIKVIHNNLSKLDGMFSGHMLNILHISTQGLYGSLCLGLYPDDTRILLGSFPCFPSSAFAAASSVRDKIPEGNR